jgi:heme/copper-type cytochrome/quinol oxidase subunit 3
MSAVISHTEAMEHEEGQTSQRSLGWYGMVFFLASEAVFFANLIASYLYLRVRAGSDWLPPPMGPGFELDRTLPVINAIILLSSSFPMHYGARAIGKGNWRLGWKLIGLAALLGAIFLGGQAWEYTHASFTPSTNIFGSAFFTLTGFHGAHVTAGVLFLTVVAIRSSRGHFTKANHFAVTAAEMYWHFVDVVWVLLFTIIYVISMPHPFF